MKIIDSSGKTRVTGFGVGDQFTALNESEVAITGTVALTSASFGKLHKITGVSGAYTVTLPAVSGNGGKIIGFYVGEFSVASSKYTLDGNGSETIDGGLTLAMCWDNRVLLYCDGTTWHVITATWGNAWVGVGSFAVNGTVSDPTGNPINSNLIAHRLSRSCFQIQGDYYQTSGGTNGSGDYLFGLPFGLNFDDGMFTVYTGSSPFNQLGTQWGTAYMTNGTVGLMGRVVMYSATQFRLLGISDVNTAGFIGSSSIGLGGKACYEFNIRLPVKDWAF